MNICMDHNCRGCGEPFPVGTARQKRFCSGCKPGRQKVYERRRSPESRVKFKAYLVDYHQRNKADPGYKEKRNAFNARYHARRPIMRLLANARARAKAQSVPCTITAADLAIPQFCPVLGIPLVRGEGAKTDNSPSIDRLRPERGYVPGNVYVISERANRLKNNGTAHEHRLIAEFMERNS